MENESQNEQHNDTDNKPHNEIDNEEFQDVPPPEDFLPSPRKPLSAFRRWPLLFPGMTFPLAFAAACLCVSLTHWNSDSDFFSASGIDVYANKHYFRLLTALFDHADISHLGLNMMPFVFFGWLLSAYFGTLMFVLGSLFVGLTSNAFTVWMYAPDTTLIGASGVVYGIIAIWLILYIRFDDENNIARKSMRVVGFILMLLFPTAYEHTTSYLAHASGFLAGIFFAVAALPLAKLRVPPLLPNKSQISRRIRKTYIVK